MTTPKAYCGNCGAEIPLFDNTKKDIGKQCVRLFEQGKEQGKQEERERILKIIGHNLIEDLADLEHRQWIEWSKVIAGADEKISEDRLDKWASLWIPYKKLSEEQKEKDRVWARKVLDILRLKIYKELK